MPAIVYDLKLKRPACVLLQATMGGTVPDFSMRFPSEDWLLAPTKNMATYNIPDSQLEQLEKFHKRKK
jgi:hypothetical protein